MPLSAFLSKLKRLKQERAPKRSPLRRFLAETLEDRILYSATPTVTVAAPATVKIGETAQVAVTFSNTGTTTGFGPIVAVALPVTGGDGTATGVTPAVTADGFTLTTPPTYLGVAVNYKIITLDDTANNGKGVLDPYAKDASGNPVYISTSDPTSPYYSMLNGSYKNGDQIMLIQLPFGSFTPGQPSAEIDFSLTLSDLANVGQNLTLKALGEFQYGNDALDNPTTDPSLIGSVSGASTSAVASTLATITTSYLGPENETATGPDYPEVFQLTLDVANGQTLSNVNIYDQLGINAQYTQVLGVFNSSGAALGYTLTEAPSTTTPGGTLEVSLTNPITGTVATDDAYVDVQFYVPRLDANGNAVLDPTTGFGTTVNGKLTSTVTTQAYGDALWTPPVGAAHSATEIGINTTVTSNPNPSALVPVSNTTNPGYYAITAKSVAVQESFVDVTQGNSTDPASMLPGDDIQISLAFQVSDYFAFSNLTLTDTLSDGLHFDPLTSGTGMTPTLQFNGNEYVLGNSSMHSANYTVGAISNADGTTTLTFDVSQELITRGEDGTLVGGGIDPNNPTGAIPNGLTDYDDGGTTGTVVFRAQVQDAYNVVFPSGDAALDPRDAVSATPLVSGSVLTLTAGLPTDGDTATDNSSGNYSITPDTVANTVYAINGDTDLAHFEDASGNLNITAGDVVTYRIVYTLPTGDGEALKFSDYIPEPIYDATEVTTFINNVNSGTLAVTDAIPAAGDATYGPTNTIQDATVSPYAGVTITTSASDNSVTFNLGTSDNTPNTPLVIDILFSVTATNSPFADGLFLTNLVQSSEHGTQTPATQSISHALVQVVIDEPELNIYKGVVASTQDGTVGTVGGVTFDGIGSGNNALSGDLTNETDATAIGDLTLTSGTLPDAGDTIRFALVVQNTGRGEAYQVSLTDTVTNSYVNDYADANAFISGTNFRLYTGSGTLLVLNADYTLTWNATSKAFTVTLLDQAPSPGQPNGVGSIGLGIGSDGTAVTNGSNSIIALYDLTVATGAQASSVVTNTATITDYANVYASGTGTTIVDTPALNFVPNGLSAKTIVDISSPSFTDVLTGTEITGTGNDAADQAVVGEEATYTLTVTIPEGTTAAAAITDTLASGLAFVAVDSVTYSSGVSSANTIGTGTTPANVTVGNANSGTGNLLTFNFGNITNTNTNNAVPETITIVYRAVVVNTNTATAAVTGPPAFPATTAGNQAGVTLANSATFSYTATPDPTGSALAKALTSAAAVVTIVEPTLSVTDQLSSDNVTYVSSLGAQQAGNTVYDKITVSNAAGDATAYDVAFSDALPSVLDGAAIVTATVNGVASSNFHIVGGVLSAINPLDIAAGDVISIVVSGTVNYSVHPADVYNSTASVTWTSISGSPGTRSTYNTASTERTGAGGVGADGAVLNNYDTTATTVLTIDDQTAQKSIVTTSEAITPQASSTDADLTIGEIVRYQLVWQVPQGTANGLTFTDILPGGLEYLADGTSTVAFISTGGQASGLSSSTLTAAADYQTGSAVVTPNSGATLTGSVSGQTLTFSLGNVTNHDDDSNAEYIVVQFNALVTNSAADHAGVTLSNSFTVGQTGATTTLLNTSNTVTSAIVEPQLTVSKIVTNGPADAGNTIDYQVTLTNNSSATGETGYNIDLTDTLPIFLTGLGGFTVTTTGTVTGLASSSNTDSFTVTAASMSQGATIVVTYTALLSTTVPADQNIVNTATATWENLPNGAGTPVGVNNTTGSALTGTLGTATGARDGSGGLSGVDDYTSSSDDTLTSNDPTVDLEWVDGSESTAGATTVATSSGANVVVGEQVTYDILVNLPEGVTENLKVDDVLPTGLRLDSYQVITDPGTGANQSSLLTTSFSGSLTGLVGPATPTTGTATFTFGNVTVPSDNDTSNNSFVIRVTATVTDVVANQQGVTLTAAAQARFTNPNDGSTVTVTDPTTGAADAGNNPVLTVKEPAVTITKTASATSPDANDTETFTITLSNTSGQEAYDVTLADTINSNIIVTAGFLGVESGSSVTPSSGASVSADAFQIVDNAGTYVLESASGAAIEIPTGESIQLTYTGTVANNVTPAEAIGDAATVKWTSTPGANVDERTGADGVGGALNDYAAVAPGTLSVASVLIDKTVVTTDLGGNDGVATIGEIVTYELTVTLPEGLISDLKIDDLLPAGMAYVAGDGITIGTTGFNGTAPTLAATTYTPGGALDLEFNPITVTPDNVTTNNTFTITYQASVLDVVGNSGASGAQTVLTNTVTDNQGSGSVFVSPTNNSASVTVVEPILTLASTLTPAGAATSADADDPVVYTLTASNATGTSAAYDTTVGDTLPTDFTSTNGAFTATVTNGATVTDVSADFSLVGGVLATTTPFTLQIGDVLKITVDGTLSTATLPGEALATTANLSYTSYPGTRTDVDGDGATVTTDHERITALPSTATLNIPSSIAITKTLTQSSDTDTTDPDLTIGEVATYQVTTSLEQGTTKTLQITDTLDAGLSYDSASASVVAGVTYGTFNVAVTANGNGTTTLVFTLTDVAVPVTATVGTGSVTIQYQATVANVAANVGLSGAQTVLNNSVFAQADYAAYYTGGAWDATSATVSTAITVVEPQLRVTTDTLAPADVGATTADAGDPMTITNTVKNTGTSTAWDVVFTSSVDANLSDSALITAQTANGNVDSLITQNGAALSGWTATYNSTTRKITFTADNAAGSIAAGASVTFAYNATLLSTVAPDTSLVNIVSVSQDYTLQGSAGRNEHGPTATDYFTTTDSLSVVKSLSASTDPDTPGDNVAIGEGATYQLVVTLEEGTTKTLVVIDRLPAGMEYDTSYVPSPTGTGITYTSFSVSSTPYNPLVATTVTFTITGLSVPVTSSVGTGTITILYKATVVDTPANQGKLGTTLTNTAYAQAAYDPDTNDTAFQATSPTVSTTVTVVEPELVITPTIAPASGTDADAGDTMTVTNTLTNSGDAVSWDTVFTSTVDAGLNDSALIAAQTANGNIDSLVTVKNGTTAVTGWIATYDSASRTITFTSNDATGSLAGGASLVFTYQAPLLTTLAPHTVLTVTSLVTGSYTLEGSGGRNEGGSSNTATFTSASHIDIAKTLAATSDTGTGHTADPDLTIGEVATYQLASNLEQGETSTLTFTDTIAAGLTYVGNAVFAGATYGTLTATPVVNGNGTTTITFVLTNVDVTATGSTATGLVTLQYQTEVANVVGNVGLSGSQTTLANSATVTADYHDSVTASAGPSSYTITVVEPQLAITSDTITPADVGATSADAGDPLTIATTLKNNGTSTAWDVIVTTTVDAALDATALAAAQTANGNVNSLLSENGGALNGWTATYNSTTRQITLTADEVNGEITSGSSVTFSYAASLLSTVAPRTTVNNAVAVTQEYTLPGDQGRAETGPASSATFTTADSLAVTKSLVADSQGDATSNLTIGETGTYDLAITLEEGATGTLVVTDTLAAGLTYIPGTTTTVSGASYSTLASNAVVNGDNTTTVTFTLTGVAVPVTTAVGTATVTLQYQALVANVAGNVGTGTQTTLQNSAFVTADYNSDGTIDATSSTVSTTITVVEPKLTVSTTLAPTATSSADAGDSMTITDTVKNTGKSAAYDAVVAMSLGAGLDDSALIAAQTANGNVTSLVEENGGALTNWTATYDSGTRLITFTAADAGDITVGTTVHFSYATDLVSTLAPDSSVSTTATVVHDYSLPSSSTTGVRRDEGGPNATASFTTASHIDITKALTGTSDADTSGSSVTIGEVATYTLTSNLEEGITNTLTFTDTLAAGLNFVTGSASFGGTGVSGTLATPTVVLNGDSTTTVTFVVTNVTVTATGTTGTGAAVLTYNAAVSDVTGNVGTGTQTTLGNSASVTANYHDAVTASAGPATASITVVEPKLAITTDTLAPTSTSAADAGDSMTVTNTLKNNGTSSAWDTVFTTTVDANLDATTLVITTPTGWTSAYDSGTGKITFTAGNTTNIAAGASVTFSYTAALLSTVPPDSTIGNATAVTQEYTLPSEAGRAEGNLPTATASFTTASHIDITKALTSTSDADTSGSNVTIGEVATYTLTSNLEQGVTGTLTFTDTLAAGLSFVTGSASFGGTGVSGTLGTPTVVVNGDSTTTVTFVVTNVTVTATGTTGTGAAVLTYNAMVSNVVGNVGLTGTQTTLGNSASVTANYHDAVTASAGPSTASITLVEPKLAITTDTLAPTSTSAADAGDSMTVTNTLTNNGTSTAWDTVFTSTVDANLDATALAAAQTSDGNVDSLITQNGGALGSLTGWTATYNSTTRKITFTADNSTGIAAAASVSFAYSASLVSTLPPDSTIGNAVAVTQEYTLPSEAGRAEGNLPTATASFTTASHLDLTKALVSTSDADTSGSSVTIGEVATYSLTSNLEQGVTGTLTFTDTLAAGLNFVTGSASFGGTGVSGTLATPTVVLNGDNTTTVTFVITNVDVTATSGTGTGAAVLTYNAVVSNVLGNVGLTGTQTTLGNSASVTANYHDAVTASAGPATASITVVEPQLAITTDTLAPTSTSSADAGDSMTVTNTLKNNGTSTAWDVVFTSTVDTNLDATALAAAQTANGNVDSLVSQNGGALGSLTGWTATYNSTTRKITFTADDSTGGIAVGASVTFAYSASLVSTLPPESTIGNAVVVTQDYTLQGESGRNEGGPTSTASFTTAANIDLTKALVGTTDANTSGSNVTIGEVATYSLTSNLEEGVTGTLTFTDTLAAGLTFVTGSASFGGTGISGTLATPTVVVNGNNTTTVTFVVTNVSVTATGSTGTGAAVLEYNAKVADVAGNVGLTGSQTTLGNSATVTANYHDAVTASAGPSTASVTVVEPHVTIGETVSNASPHLGDTLTYTVTLTNTGTSEAYGSDLVLSEPGALSITGITGTVLTGATADSAAAITGGGGGLTGTYDIAAGGTVVITYTVAVSTDPSTIGGTYGAAGNTLNATAQVNWTSLSGVVAGERTDASGASGSPDNYLTATASPLAPVTVVGSDISLTKTDGVTTVSPGDTFTYTLTATDTGTAAATGVVIVDTLPSTEIFVSADDGGVYTGGTVIGGVNYGGTVTWTIGNVGMGSGSAVPVTVTVSLPSVVAATTETVFNTATATQDDVDPTPSNNTATDTDTVDAAPDLVVTKTASVAAADANAPVTWTITVTNVGNQDASSVVLTDPIDTSLVTFTSATGGGTDVADVATWNLGTLAGGGGTTSVQVTATVNAPLPPLVSTLTNTASATFNQTLSGNDPTPANNSASVTIFIPETPDMSVTDVNSTNQIGLGDSFTYTLTVADVGYRTTTGVTVTDVIDPNVIFVSASQGGVYDAATRTITWTGLTTPAIAGNFLGADTEIVKLLVVVAMPNSSTIMGNILNTATVKDDGTNGIDPRLSNNTATVTTPVFSFIADTFENFSLPSDQVFSFLGTDTDQSTIDSASSDPEDVEDAANAIRLGPYYVPPHYRYDPPILTLMPLYSGAAEPGSTLVIEIYNTGGAEVGTESVVADAGGNWVASFPSTVLRDYPQTVTITSQPPVNADQDSSGFNLRTYFSPAVNSSHFFRQQLSVGNVFAELPSAVLRDEYEAAAHPINFNVTGHAYEFLSSQPTAAGY